MRMSEYSRLAYQFKTYKPEHGINYNSMQLPAEAGEVAGKVAKALRDEDGIIDDDRRAAILKELGDVLWSVNALALELGFTLDTVARVNLEKLKDRAARGKLGGDGDNR